ncbi:helix-turn-helix domain-containing protein [Brevundimonas sp.]|uniref:helix-turn-helix domain-containing protein n=1 Tax=Brevundimonas sp. TaxID=1871086 RepID=UPI0037845692
MAYILGQEIVGDGPLTTLFAMVGVASCGWSWLLARALFDPAERDARWPRIVVAIVWLTGIAAIAAGPEHGPFETAADNAYALSGSAALLLTFVEPFQGFRRSLPKPEQRFRIAFLVVYAALVAASILLLGEAQVANASFVKSLCASVGLVAVGSALWFRARHPLVPTCEAKPATRVVTAQDRLLAQRILALLNEEKLHVNADLKVADLVHRLAEPEHRVTRSIAALGFANFNRLINHHRIEQAKQMLDAPGLTGRPILLIAFDCGFASIGPFNRAFKDETGLTPRAYRNRSSAGQAKAATPDATRLIAG